MALVQVIEIATGIVVAEYQVPPTEEIELEPGQRVLFPEVSFGDVQAPDIILDNLEDTDVQVTFTEGDESFTVTIKNLYLLLEEGETVELLRASGVVIVKGSVEDLPEGPRTAILEDQVLGRGKQ